MSKESDQGAGSGAVSGAAAGTQVSPGYGTIIGGLIGAGVGAASAKKRKITAPDMATITRVANEGAGSQIQTAHSLTEALRPVNAQYAADSKANAAGLKSQVATLGEGFKDEQARLGAEKATDLSNTLRQNVISAQPEIQRGLRETLAASGGLNRGATTVAASQVGREAMDQIGRGEAAIEQQRLQGLQDASNKVFGANIAAVSTATGLDASTIQTLLNSGRQDLIQEAQSIMQATRERTSNLLGIGQNQNTINLATQTANAEGQNQLTQALLQAGGQALGSYYGNTEKR